MNIAKQSQFLTPNSKFPIYTLSSPKIILKSAMGAYSRAPLQFLGGATVRGESLEQSGWSTREGQVTHSHYTRHTIEQQNYIPDSSPENDVKPFTGNTFIFQSAYHHATPPSPSERAGEEVEKKPYSSPENDLKPAVGNTFIFQNTYHHATSPSPSERVGERSLLSSI